MQLEEARKPHPLSPPPVTSDDVIRDQLEEALQGTSILTEDSYREVLARNPTYLTPQDLIQVLEG